MKPIRTLLLLPLLAVAVSAGGCSWQTSEPTAQEAVTVEKTADAQPAESLFHYSKADSKSLAENLLWDYFDAWNRQDLDTVMNLMNQDMQGVYEWEDRMALKNIKSAKVKRIYDMTSQSPKTKFVEARYFYVEVNYETLHLFDSNDSDGENYRLAIVVRETANSPYKLIELSHCPKMKEVDANAKEEPGTSIAPFTNPSILVQPGQPK